MTGAPDVAPAPAEPVPGSTWQAPALHEGRDDAGWQLYHETFRALLEGKRKRATGLAAKLRREHAGHPATALVVSSPLGVTGGASGVRRAVREEPSASANAELALFQTLHGLALGIELCAALDCEEGGGYLGLSLAGGAAGAIASLKVIGPITSGQRALLNSGTAWGAFNAIMAAIAADPDDGTNVALGLMGGQLAGLAVGGALLKTRPTAGQVGLATSGGQWAAVLMGLTLAASTTEASSAEIALSLLVSADIGIGIGAYIGQLRPDISRGQTYVIDAGGIVGGVAGGGLGVLLSGDVNDRSTAAAAAIGVAAGLGVAAYFTRNWGDSDDDDGGGPRALVLPVEQGRGGLLGVAGAW